MNIPIKLKDHCNIHTYIYIDGSIEFWTKLTDIGNQ